MLNELKLLADSIQAAGFSGEEWDDKLKEIKVKGSPCFVVDLSAEGEIEGLRFLEQDKAKVLRTWQGGSNGECFPSFNFLPFYELSEDKKNPLTTAQKKAAIESFVADFLKLEEPPEQVGPVRLADRKKADPKTGKCLGSIASKFFDIVSKGASPDDSFVRFKNAFSKLAPTDVAATFNRKLLSFLRSNLTPEMPFQKDPPTIWSLLFSRTPDVVLFFDCPSETAFPIASEKGVRTINARLLSEKKSAPAKSGATETDAFGESVSVAELAGKLPEVKLPGAIANTKLRSMSSESKCQARYGRIDAESFPIGNKARAAMKSALAWISSPEREGKTWAFAGVNELVFAYPKSLPPSPPLLARLFGNGWNSESTGGRAEARFEQYAADALRGLKTVSETATPTAQIEVFAIKKADNAHRKVVFYRNYSLAKLEESVSGWLAGADNIPDIVLRKWPRKEKGTKSAKGTRPVPLEFRAPLPLAATRLVYTMWSKDGNEKLEPEFRSGVLYEGYPVFDGLELFLGDAVPTGLASRMLSLFLQGTGSLCAAVGNLSHGRLARKRDVIENGHVAEHLETALPLLGILLHKLNRTKENYMDTAPYLIGRFLNLADGLHAVWCRNVKKDDPLPPQLLGSSLFASFQLNPVQAFANASLRFKTYLDWAKTNQTKDVALTRWFVGEFGRVSSAIKEAGIPARLSDADKAEMLLGYLASSAKNAESEPAAAESTES